MHTAELLWQYAVAADKAYTLTTSHGGIPASSGYINRRGLFMSAHAGGAPLLAAPPVSLERLVEFLLLRRPSPVSSAAPPVSLGLTRGSLYSSGHVLPKHAPLVHDAQLLSGRDSVAQSVLHVAHALVFRHRVDVRVAVDVELGARAAKLLVQLDGAHPLGHLVHARDG